MLTFRTDLEPASAVPSDQQPDEIQETAMSYTSLVSHGNLYARNENMLLSPVVVWRPRAPADATAGEGEFRINLGF